MYKSLLLLFAVVALNSKVCYSADNFKVIFHDLTINYFNPEYFSKFTASLSTTDGEVSVDSSCVLEKDVDKPINVNVQVFDKKNGAYDGPNLYAVQTELCTAFEKPEYYPTLTKIYTNLLKHSKLPLSCPIKKGQYDINKHVVDQSVFPSDMIGDYWKINVETLHDKVVMYNYTIHMQIDRSKM